MVYQDIKFLFLDDTEIITHEPLYFNYSYQYQNIYLIKSLDDPVDLIINLLSWMQLKKYNYLDKYLKLSIIKYNIPYHKKSYCEHRFIRKTICPISSCGLFFAYDDLLSILRIIPKNKQVGILTGHNISAGILLIIAYKILLAVPLNKIFKHHRLDRLSQIYIENFFCYVKEHHLFLTSHI